MTTYIVYSKLNDGYNDGSTVDSTGATLYAGRIVTMGAMLTGFMSFDTSAIPDTNTVESAALTLNSMVRNASGVSRTYTVHQSTWEPTLDGAESLSGTVYGTLPASGNTIALDESVISVTSSTQLAIAASNTASTLIGYLSWASAEVNPAALIIQVSARSTLYGFDKASVQLPTFAKNGEPIVASIWRGTTSLTTVNIGYYNLNSVTYNIIGTVGSELDVSQDGAQTVALATDSVGNLYVIGQFAETQASLREGHLYLKKFARTGTSTWSTSAQPIAISLYGGSDTTPTWVTNQIAVDYLAGADGLQLVVSDTEGGRTFTGFISISQITASTATSVLSNPTRVALSYGNQNDPVPNSPLGYRPTGLDLISIPDITSGRYMISGRGSRSQIYSSTGVSSLLSMNEYPIKQKLLASQSTTVSRYHSGAGITAGVQDGIFRTILPITGSVAGSTLNLILGSSLYGGSAGRRWDAVYSSAANVEWVFYVPTTNSGRDIHMAAVSPTSNSVSLGSVVATNLGAAGTTVTGIRVTANATDDRYVIVEYSLLTSAGVASTGAVAWSPQATGLPNAPSLFPRASYSASASALFSWSFSDPNTRDTQRGYQLVVATAVAPTVAVYDTTQLTSGVSSHTIAASALSNNTNYVWRVRTQDQTGFWGSWSSNSAFSTTDSGAVVIVTPSADNLPSDLSYVDLEWTYSSTSGMTQASRRVKVIRTSDSAVISDTGNITTSLKTYTVTGLPTDTEFRIEISVVSNLGITSIMDSVLVILDYDTPLQPTINTAVLPNYIEISISNPDSGSRPAVIRNEIWKREAGTDGLRRRIGYVFNGGVYQDFEVASKVLYEYEVRSIAASETFAVSDIFFETAAGLEGVWLHRPSNAVSTTKHFMYGNIGRSEDLSVGFTPMSFIGRTKPVFEFTTEEDQSVSLNIDIPNGSTLSSDVEYIRSLVRAREIVCYRDNRQRLLYGFLTGVSITDVAFGYKVSGTLATAEHTDEI